MESATPISGPVRRLLRAATHPLASCLYLLLTLMPLLFAGRYNHPSSDDFSNSTWTDFWAYQRQLYFHLTGRVFSSIVISLDPIHWGAFGWYKVEAGLLIVAVGLSYALTLAALLKRVTTQSFRTRFFLGVLATFVMFNGAPSLSEGFYWLTGAMTYTLPILMLCWATGIGLKMDRTAPRRTVALAVLQGFLVAGATACNEVVIAVPGAVCAVLFLHYRRMQASFLQRWYATLFCVWAIVAAVAILAPGNYVREGLQSRNTAILLPTWLYFSKQLFLEWIADPVFIAFSLGYVALAYRYRPLLRLRTLPLLLLSAGLIALIFFPACWALGRMPPLRVRNLAYMLFIPAWMLTLTAAADGLRRLMMDIPASRKYLRSTLLIAGAMLLLIQFRIETLRASSNYWLLAKGLRKHTLQNYDAEQLARYEMLTNGPADTVRVPRLKFTQSNVVYFSDLGDDPEKFPNLGAAALWKKHRIILLADSLRR